MRRVHVIAVLLLAAGLANAGEIYHWVDEAGVAHYSQTPPDNTDLQVETRELPASTPDDYDPRDDEYSVMNQAARIHAGWEALAEERDAEREARREAFRAEREHRGYEVDRYRAQHQYGWRYGREFHYPPVHPRPPFRPGRKLRDHQFRQLDELDLWREPAAYSVNSTRHWQRVQQTRTLALP